MLVSSLCTQEAQSLRVQSDLISSYNGQRSRKTNHSFSPSSPFPDVQAICIFTEIFTLDITFIPAGSYLSPIVAMKNFGSILTFVAVSASLVSARVLPDSNKQVEARDLYNYGGFAKEIIAARSPEKAGEAAVGKAKVDGAKGNVTEPADPASSSGGAKKQPGGDKKAPPPPPAADVPAGEQGDVAPSPELVPVTEAPPAKNSTGPEAGAGAVRAGKNATEGAPTKKGKGTGAAKLGAGAKNATEGAAGKKAKDAGAVKLGAGAKNVTEGAATKKGKGAGAAKLEAGAKNATEGAVGKKAKDAGAAKLGAGAKSATEEVATKKDKEAAKKEKDAGPAKLNAGAKNATQAASGKGKTAGADAAKDAANGNADGDVTVQKAATPQEQFANIVKGLTGLDVADLGNFDLSAIGLRDVPAGNAKRQIADVDAEDEEDCED
ncbi:uncharacterized protein RAG0_09662 [Rhynchosporium agropyri]|uniref:Uncharacterized protein n=1 Tax=Rhynchosporium agropyri TaxID=914238 RepID=A0A1E1KWH8_9HELO|nr:uncharacterized protein RAG0_09662 [Rhynchosporium agropyri]